MLVVYGVFAAYAFGLLMNLSGWPFVLGIEVPGHDGLAVLRRRATPLRENLHRFARLHAADLDRQLGHRPRDHHLGGDRRARPGRADDAATGRAPGHRHRRRAGRVRRPGRRRGPRYPTDVRSSAVARVTQDPVVAAAGSPRPSRLLVVTHSRPSGRDRHGAHPAVLADEEVGGCRGPPPADVDPPQPLARAARPARGGRRAKASPDGEATSVSQTTWGSMSPSCAAAALDQRPAVVVARLDQVELVEGVLAELRGPQPVPVVEREPLHVAVAVGPDRRVRERVAGGRSPSGVIRRILPPRESGPGRGSPSPVSPVEA